MRILIIEDEIPAYEKLKSFVRSSFEKLETVTWIRSVKEGKEKQHMFSELDLIFSDIQLLDGNTFELLDGISIDIPIIFCTAFDQYLLKAFQANGIAYLLKPYDKKSFQEAISKYNLLFAKEEPKVDLLSKSAIEQIKNALQANEKNYKTRFAIKKKSGLKLLSVDDITGIRAKGDFCIAFDDLGKQHTLNFSIGHLASVLDPKRFFRINRSEIVHIDHIQNIEPYFKNRVIVRLNKSDEDWNTSTAKTPEFRIWLEN